MQIKFIIYYYTVIFMLTIVASGIAFWQVSNNVEFSLAMSTLESNIRFDIAQLSSITSNYVLNNEENAVHRWKTKYDEISVSLTSLRDQSHKSYCIIELKKICEKIGWTFDTMVSVKNNGDYVSQLASQLFDLIIEFQNKAHHINHYEKDRVEKSTRYFRNIMIAMFSFLFILTISALMFVRRRILGPLYALRKDVSSISAGTPKFEYTPHVKDEFGDLSDAFQEMILKQRQAELKRQETLAFTETILLKSPFPKGVYRHDGQCVLANEALAAMAGTTIDKSLTQNFYHIESWKKSGLLDTCIKVLAENQQKQFDLNTISSFGKEVSASIFIIPTMLNGEQHIVIQLFDKTEIEKSNKQLKQTQSKLKQTLAELNVILENAGVGINLVKNRVQIKSNRYMAKLFGYDFEEMQECPSHILYASKEDYEKFGQKAYPVILSGERFRDELKMKRKDNSLIWIKISGKAIKPDCPEKGSVWVFEDISEQKLNEIRLHDSEERYRSLFEGNSVVMLLINPHTGNIEDANHAAVSYYGWRRSKLKRMNISEINTLSKEKVYAAMNEAASYKKNFFEFRHRMANGDIRDVNVYSGRILANGKELLYSCIIDVTEAKSNKKELVKAKESAEKANKSKSLFLANMSHEIRTPLNAVIGLSQLLLNTELNNLQRDYLNKMYKSSRSLLGIINDILDYSKIEAGKLSLESNEFELTEILDSTSQLFSYSAEEKGLELIFDIDPNIPVLLVGDALRLQQIINNLLGNAIKFTHQGHIKLTIKCVTSDNDKDLTLKVAVSDTGIGMTHDQIHNLFNAFHQADISMTRKYGGTGLGLTICKQLVEMMGGQIGVKSEIDKGSVFHFTIRMGVSDRSIPEHFSADLRGMRTLVVEDQEIARHIIQEILESWNFNVQTAETGDEGLNLALKAFESQKPFELVIVDWKLPNMNGIELAMNLREEEKKQNMLGKHTILIMMTAFGRQILVETAQNVQFDAVLDKPIIASQLYNIIVNLQSYKPDQKSIKKWNDFHKVEESLQPINGAKILLVEDNPTNQLVAKEMLKHMGLEVDIAINGVEAISKSKLYNYDAILMDIQMPDMDGIQATRSIRALSHRGDVPIIAMTAAAMESDRMACNEVGMNDFIPKPIDLENLAAALLRWIPARNETCISGSSDASLVCCTESAIKSFDVEGLNLTEAVQRMGNNWNLLYQTLHRFRCDFSNKISLINDYVANHHWQDASRLIHTIKGASSQIGAERLLETSRKLEQELELESEPTDALNNFRTEFVRVLNALENLPEITTESINPLDHIKLKESVQKIFSFITQAQFVPPDLIFESIQQLDGFGQKAFSKRLKKCMDQFDYTTAKELLLQISRTFNFTLKEES